jgi:TPR repeat protein
LFRKAADRGNADAQFNLGYMYTEGQGMRRDQVAGARWYRKAADQGRANAQFNLALLYQNGKGVPRDYGAAATWFRKAADQGYVDAQLNLGIMYSNGQGVPQDYAAANAKDQGAAVDDGKAPTWLNLTAIGGDKAAARNKDLLLHASPKRKSRWY